MKFDTMMVEVFDPESNRADRTFVHARAGDEIEWQPKPRHPLKRGVIIELVRGRGRIAVQEIDASGRMVGEAKQRSPSACRVIREGKTVGLPEDVHGHIHSISENGAVVSPDRPGERKWLLRGKFFGLPVVEGCRVRATFHEAGSDPRGRTPWGWWEIVEVIPPPSA